MSLLLFTFSPFEILDLLCNENTGARIHTYKLDGDPGMFVRGPGLRGSRYVCNGDSFMGMLVRDPFPSQTNKLTGIPVCLYGGLVYGDPGMFVKGVPLRGSRYVCKRRFFHVDPGMFVQEGSFTGIPVCL